MADEKFDIGRLIRANQAKPSAEVMEQIPIPPAIPAPEPNIKDTEEARPTPSKLLDITRPGKWGLMVEVYLDSLKPREAEQWLEDFREIHDIAAKRVKIKVEVGTAGHCFVCGQPFRNGQPGGGVAHYIDGERNFINVWCCHPSEYPELLKKAKEKDDRFRHAEEEREKAARAAAVRARQARP